MASGGTRDCSSIVYKVVNDNDEVLDFVSVEIDPATAEIVIKVSSYDEDDAGEY